MPYYQNPIQTTSSSPNRSSSCTISNNGKRRTQTITGPVPNNTSRCSQCNAATSSTKNPGSLNHGIDYKRDMKSSTPPCIINRSCIAGGQFATKNNFNSTGYYAKQGCSELVPPPIPGQGCDSCTGIGCSDQILGKVIIDPDRDGSISWSSINTTALAGTPAANPYVIIRHSDGCGVPECGSDQGDMDGDLRYFDSLSTTWRNYVPTYASDEDSISILGTGAQNDPYVLDREYIAANLEQIIGSDLLQQYGWTQTP